MFALHFHLQGKDGKTNISIFMALATDIHFYLLSCAIFLLISDYNK